MWGNVNWWNCCMQTLLFCVGKSWNEVESGKVKVEKLKRVLEWKDIKVNIWKARHPGIVQLREVMYGRWILVVSVVNELVVTLLCAQNVFNLCCSDMPGEVSLLSSQDVLVCRMCLGHNCSVKEKIELKRGNANFRWDEKFVLVTWLARMLEHLKQWLQEQVLPGRKNFGNCSCR